MAMPCGRIHSRLLCALMTAALPFGLSGQSPLVGSGPGGTVRMFPTDLAVLETQEPRKDLPCTVTPVKPTLGFDLRFHAGYEVSVPLKELAGTDNSLTMIFRVTPENRKDDPYLFVQRVQVPPLRDDASGNAYLQGAFDVGEGKYHVDWLMRDRSERVCSAYWDIEAELSARDKPLVLSIEPGVVQAAEPESFQQEPPVERVQNEPLLNVKVMLNFAPHNATAAIVQPLDTAALVSMLRTLARDPHIGKFSLVAFNLQEQRILYRQEYSDYIDFPALGEALRSLNLGTVDLKRLSKKNGETDFLANLIQQEVGGEDRPDALIFAGPKALVDESVPRESLQEVGEVEYPVFYMNYNLQPRETPWRDAIGRAVRFFRGYEYTISRPRDLWTAVSEIVSKAVKFREGRRTSGAASQ